MLVLGVLVGLMLIGIGVMLVMRQRKKKTSKDPNSVTLIQRGGESVHFFSVEIQYENDFSSGLG